MRITVQMLAQAGACNRSMLWFLDAFPGGADVTRENLEISEKAGLDLAWFRHLLPPSTTREALLDAILAAQKTIGDIARPTQADDRAFVEAIIEAILGAVQVEADAAREKQE